MAAVIVADELGIHGLPLRVMMACAKGERVVTLWVVTVIVATFAGFAFANCNYAAASSGRFRIAQTSTVTNCMMACNSQAASCQTTCLVPGTPSTNAATTTSNASQNTSCQLNCTTQQINCQTTCGTTSTSQ
jgi:hypothetical protein